MNKMVDKKEVSVIKDGEERTDEEIFIKSLLAYMKEEHIPIEIQLKYIVSKYLYLNDEYTKNEGNDFIFNGLSTAGIIGLITTYLLNKDELAIASAIITLGSMATHMVINAKKRNIYLHDVEFYEDIYSGEKKIRKAMKKRHK